ncbi:unnamed protein product [Didymodactylos carnosus]|uniref:Uncharacterized protein n=1 Tax=Didymodactylos carnosus TaxID=1234261 RepID=A0A815TJR2_9BILA|nr:unnamed protein product [Didymodactylos carnosus]CAF1502970.1 unnamed protein product [Didymodactylos carnosus]CAF3852735.1 unnamed protein product [Didymodactylos carnosus]CAF4364501.1 unnamed protein product [Didymodactylos carnosus]
MASSLTSPVTSSAAAAVESPVTISLASSAAEVGYSDQDARCVHRTAIENNNNAEEQCEDEITYFRSKELKDGSGLAI